MNRIEYLLPLFNGLHKFDRSTLCNGMWSSGGASIESIDLKQSWKRSCLILKKRMKRRVSPWRLLAALFYLQWPAMTMSLPKGVCTTDCLQRHMTTGKYTEQKQIVNQMRELINGLFCGLWQLWTVMQTRFTTRNCCSHSFKWAVAWVSKWGDKIIIIHATVWTLYKEACCVYCSDQL